MTFSMQLTTLRRQFFSALAFFSPFWMSNVKKNLRRAIVNCHLTKYLFNTRNKVQKRVRWASLKQKSSSRTSHMKRTFQSCDFSTWNIYFVCRLISPCHRYVSINASISARHFVTYHSSLLSFLWLRFVTVCQLIREWTFTASTKQWRGWHTMRMSITNIKFHK